MSNPVQRGPNYNWEIEALHYQEECDRLRKLIDKLDRSSEALQAERDAYREVLLRVKKGIEETATDTIWSGPCCTACDEIAIVLDRFPGSG